MSAIFVTATGTDVGKTYGAIRALKGINLTVNAGDVTCVLGDNGAGERPDITGSNLGSIIPSISGPRGTYAER